MLIAGHVTGCRSGAAAAGVTRRVTAPLRLLHALVQLIGVAALLAAAGPPAHAAQPHAARTVQGVVTRVTDGDSLWITPPAQRAVEVRLRDIDAPEICQVWGIEARRALETMLLGRSVVLRIAGRDRHGRTLGDVWVDGVDVGVRMVEQGHAWSLRSRGDSGPLRAQERRAAALGLGLHGQPAPVMPRDFRQSHGPCVAGLAADRAVPAAAAAAPPASGFRCDGRTRCAQMTSCDEARYFLQHCPGVKMDGDGDGVPCETQWCRR